MLEKANTAHAEALKNLDKIREKQKKIGTTTHILLDELLPSTSGCEKVLKGSGKKRKEKSGEWKRGEDQMEIIKRHLCNIYILANIMCKVNVILGI